MQAITTKYLGPTDSRPSRITAFTVKTNAANGVTLATQAAGDALAAAAIDPREAR